MKRQARKSTTLLCTVLTVVTTSGCLTTDVPPTASLPASATTPEDSPEQIDEEQPVAASETAGVATLNLEPLEGVTRPVQMVEVSSLVAGMIDTLHVTEGQSVEKGTALISLDSRVPAARLAAAEVDATSTGSLIRAQVGLRVAESYLKRLRSADPGAVREIELEEAEGNRGRC